MKPPIVLVIDADPMAHDHIADALADEECMILGAGSEAVALRLAERRPPGVVILDAASVRAPAELVQRLQRIAPRLLALIAIDDASLDGATNLAAVGAVLCKPLDPEVLQSAVRSSSRLSAMTDDTAQVPEGVVPAHAVWRRIATTRGRG